MCTCLVLICYLCTQNVHKQTHTYTHLYIKDIQNIYIYNIYINIYKKIKLTVTMVPMNECDTLIVHQSK